MAEQDMRQRLIQKGESQGFVTYDDVLELLPNAEQNIEGLERLLEELARAGVTVREEPNKAPPQDGSSNGHAPEEPSFSEEEPSDEELGQLDQNLLSLIDDAGYQQALETDDVIGLYLKEAGRVPLLASEEEISLAKRIEAGTQAHAALAEFGSELPPDDRFDLEATIADAQRAEDHLIRANARLVISIAKKYVGRGVPFLDLIQEGNIGLIRAVRKFEYWRGHKFSTYAT